MNQIQNKAYHYDFLKTFDIKSYLSVNKCYTSVVCIKQKYVKKILFSFYIMKTILNNSKFQ